MPAKRLPWYKVWAEHTDHEKICALSDAEYRTWHMVLAKAAQQPIRWRFASARHAAAVTNRPERQITALTAAGLMDSREDGLWVHDSNVWQRWTPEDDANDSRTPPERLANNSRTTREAPSRPLERGDRNPDGLLTEPETEGEIGGGKPPATTDRKKLTELRNSGFTVTQELLEWAQSNLLPELSVVELRNATLEWSEYWQSQPRRRSLPGWERSWKTNMIRESARKLAKAS